MLEIHARISGQVFGVELRIAAAPLVALPLVGQYAFKKQLGTESFDISYGVAIDSKGSVYISGGTEGALGEVNQGSSDAWVAKYNSAGTLLQKMSRAAKNDKLE